MNFDLRLWASCWSFRQTQYNISLDWRVASRNSTFPKPSHSVCSSFCSNLLQWRHMKGGSGQILKLLILQRAGLNLLKTGFWVNWFWKRLNWVPAERPLRGTTPHVLFIQMPWVPRPCLKTRQAGAGNESPWEATQVPRGNLLSSRRLFLS